MKSKTFSLKILHSEIKHKLLYQVCELNMTFILLTLPSFLDARMLSHFQEATANLSTFANVLTLEH